MKKTILCLVALLATFFVHAQRYTNHQLRENPVWIQMMSDTLVNYDEAKQAFEIYWENRELPLEENELFSAAKSEKESASFASSKKRKSLDATKYAFEYKKFKKWLIKNEGFVKPDGYIMTPHERIQAWKQQMENRK